MLRVLYFCLALSFCILQVKSQSSEYTWEDYDGTIPEKAFMASDDPNNPIYVGMAMVGKDNCTGTLFPGAKELMVSCNGMHTIKEGIKILTVNDPKKIKWFPTPRVSILQIWTEIRSVGEPVTCGISSETKTSTLVARTITDDDGSLVVGHLNNGIFYLVHNNTRKSQSNNYEILIIVKEPVPAPPQSDEYTWEDYDGTIPEKAFSVSDDPNNPVYVGLALIYRDYCPGTLLPGATEITVECGGKFTINENLKILTVNDPKKFQWLPAPRKGSLWDAIKGAKGKPITSGPNLAREKTTTLVGRTITDDGNLDVGHYNYGVFYWIHDNGQRQKTSNYDILIIVEVPALPQSDVSKEPSASEVVLNQDQPTADANLDVEAAVEAPPAFKEPTVDVDANVDLEAEANAQVVPIPPSASKEPAALTSSELTVDANVDLEADANAQVVPKSPPASKEPAALTPSELTVDANMDLEADANAQLVPKSPSASKEPAVNTNVDLKVEADAQTAPKAPLTPKAPPTSKTPIVLDSPADSEVNPFAG